MAPENPSPLLEPVSIRLIAEELEDPEYALSFLESYLSLLPYRIQRIQTALSDQDVEAAMDAVLSLKITSSMTGALDAEAGCRTIEWLIRAGRFTAASVTAQSLTTHVQALITAGPRLLLEARLHLVPGNADLAPLVTRPPPCS